MISAIFRTAVCALLLMTASTAAHAGCKKPSGTFVGSGSGLAYYTGSGDLYQAGAISLSITVFGDGSVTASETGKLLTSGLYTTSWSVYAYNNVFNTTTCQGTILDTLGRRYTYTASNAGKVLTFVYTSNDNILALYTLRLEKI